MSTVKWGIPVAADADLQRSVIVEELNGELIFRSVETRQKENAEKPESAEDTTVDTLDFA